MTRLLLTGIGLVAAVGFVPAQERKADNRVKVDVFLATEHVPKDLDAGTRVDVKIVTGKTVNPKGQTLYQAVLVAKEVEVFSVLSWEKPLNSKAVAWKKLLMPKDVAEKEAAAWVTLLVPKDVAEKVEKARGAKEKPVTLRLELAEPDTE